MNEKRERLDIKIRSNTKDLFAFTKLVPERKKRIENASSERIKSDPINELAQKLHPDTQYLIIDDIIEETKTSRSFKLIPDPDSSTKELAYFRAGQYLSLKVGVNGTPITRPYSISSSPTDALKGFYIITMKKEEDGFLTDFAFKNWQLGTKVSSSGPEGFFYYEPIRDKRILVGLAGGSGITPFRSMARDIIERNLDIKLTIIYGSSDEQDIIFYDELKELERNYPDKIKLIVVLSCDEITLEGCETGFITSEIIQKYVNVEESSFFICGPQVMYEFVDEELKKFNLPYKRIRREFFGEIKNPFTLPDFPLEMKNKTFIIKVKIGGLIKEIPAKGDETILVALERAKMSPPSKCRSGECGSCRSQLIAGKVYVTAINDGRREADKKFNFIHTCSSYPITDLELAIPRKKG
ncbi:MAG: iron-sulfur cluster-binding domain-containing protein [Candidatus Lokiarchaeota archaeon]